MKSEKVKDEKLKPRASLNKTTLVVLLSDARCFIEQRAWIQLFIRHFFIYMQWFLAFPSDALRVLLRRFDILPWRPCLVSSATLPFDFECLVLQQKRPCPSASGTLSFDLRLFAPCRRLLCSVSSATLTRIFGHFAPLVREGGRGKEEALPTLKGECGRGYLFP